jgi:hypothetical protein
MITLSSTHRRFHLIYLDSGVLSRFRRPAGRFHTELLGILDVQSLPVELHRVTANDGADGNGKLAEAGVNS